MTREVIAKFFGEEWVDFMVPFVQSDSFKGILEFLKTEKAAGKVIFPEQAKLFRCFKDLPLSKVRVVILGQDPYPLEGYSDGLAFSHPMTKKIAPSLEKVIDAIEVEYFNGLNFDKENFNTDLSRWVDQGVLLLNTALTVVEKTPGSHAEIWRPFTQFVVDQLTEVRRDIIFLAWGKQAQSFTEKIHFAKHFVFSCEHPAAAAREKRAWECKHFTLTNACITGSKLEGGLINWE